MADISPTGEMAALAKLTSNWQSVVEDNAVTQTEQADKRRGQGKPLTRPGATEMATNDLLRRISIDPNVCFGKPVIRGTRIWVSLILDFLANGDSIETILAEYPHLTRDDIQACLAYGAELANERYILVPMSETA